MEDSPVPAVATVLHAIREALTAVAGERETAGAPTRIAIALSGGRDSMVLLDALALLAPELHIDLSAVHVHHGLSPNAERWAEFCVAHCAERRIPFGVERVHVERVGGASLEATARAARYAVLGHINADVVALAHHADDQAETLLLQLLRGAGPHGLAAMPRQHPSATGPVLLRPLLGLAREAIDRYATARALAWVEDESNANTGIKRNFLRRKIAPSLAKAFPGYPATLVRAARHQAESATLIDELAALDATGAISDVTVGATLDRAQLIALAERAPHRARNLLRWFLRQRGLAAPSAARLAAMLQQLTQAARDARVQLLHDGAELGFHRDRIVVHAPVIAPFAILWQGEPALTLAHGRLEFATCIGAGIARAALDGVGVTVRTRSGDERIRLAANRPRQTLKNLLQNAGMPWWQRVSLPLVFRGDTLAVVPGIGVDVAFQAAPDAPGYAVHWHPAGREV